MTKPHPAYFALAIARGRMDKQMSQRQLAKAVGVSHSYISHVEAGRRWPSLSTLIRIGEVLCFRVELVRGVTAELNPLANR